MIGLSACNISSENKPTIDIEETTIKPVVYDWVNEELNLRFASNDDFKIWENNDITEIEGISVFEQANFEIKLLATNEEKIEYIGIFTTKDLNVNKDQFVSMLHLAALASKNAKFVDKTTEEMLGKTYDVVTTTRMEKSIQVMSHIGVTEYEDGTTVLVCIIYPTDTPEAKTEILSMFN